MTAGGVRWKDRIASDMGDEYVLTCVLCRIFLDIFNALLVLRERLGIDPACPTIKSTRSKWRVLRTWRQSKKNYGMVRVGEEYRDGVDVNQEKLLEVLLALNSFIYAHRE